VSAAGRGAAVLAALFIASAACSKVGSADSVRRSETEGVTIVLEPTPAGDCCVVTTVNPRSSATTVVCFVEVFDEADRLLAASVVPPIPPGHRRSSGFEAPPGRFEQGVQRIPLELPEQHYRSTCRPAAWHGGAPI
jgi:hypothetical protein